MQGRKRPTTILCLIAAGFAVAYTTPADAALVKTKTKFDRNTNATVTSGTPGCIVITTPMPIAVGKRDRRVPYVAVCVAGAAPCSSAITVSGTKSDGTALNNVLDRTLFCNANCLAGESNIGLECESDACICGADDSLDCVYDYQDGCPDFPSCSTCDLLGACVDNLGCFEDVQTECEGGGGTYLGDGTQCPTGACCSSGGTMCSCQEAITEFDCSILQGSFFEGAICDNVCIDGNCIPAVSEWGMIAMVLLVLTAATVIMSRRRAFLEGHPMT